MSAASQTNIVFTSKSSQWKLQIHDAMVTLEKSLQNAILSLVNSKETRPLSPCFAPSCIKVAPGTCSGVMAEDNKRKLFQLKDEAIPEGGGENAVHLPTTKETEAADVLMELSGKAKRKKTFDPPPDGPNKTLIEDDRRAVIYAAPIETSYLSHERRETVAAPGEVSMINEKDLLPLATEVICQYCPQQCEDLVELHEHVLAMHNMSEMCLQPNKKKPDEVTASDEKERTCEKSPQDAGHCVQSKESTILPSDDMILPFIPLTQGLISDSATYMPTNVKGRQSNVSKVDLTGSSIAYAAVGLPVQNRDENILLLMPGHLESNQGPSRVTNNCGAHVNKETYVMYMCAVCFHGFLTKHEYTTHVCRGSEASEILETSLIDVVVSIPVLEEKSQSGELGKDSGIENKESTMKMMQYKIHEKEIVLKEFRLLNVSEGKLIKEWTLKHSTTGKILTLHTDPSLLDQCNIMYRCSECDVNWDDFSSFVSHRIDGPCVFRCTQCSLMYPTPNKLAQHQSSYHASVEDRTCPVCGLVFEKRHLRNKHLKTQCSKQHKCEECGAVLKNIYSLNDHLKTHQECLFKCTECGASFHRKSVLSRHMRKHTGLKPHQCDRCNLSFYTKQHLQTHQDRHDGNKRHKCTLCDKGFYSKSDRDRHVARGHCSSANKSEPTVTRTTPDKILAV
ncbi:uncharacterized protein LOC143028242 isoform X2 [Oratosquilla oratoria]